MIGGKAPADPAKIMLGPMSGLPIVLAPVNDSLGLAITEGIEDGLSVFEETGLRVWAAGSAGNMPKSRGAPALCRVHHDIRASRRNGNAACKTGRPVDRHHGSRSPHKRTRLIMAKGPDWNDVHRANPGAVRDALTEPDIPFDHQPKAHDAFYSDWPQSGLQKQAEFGEGVSIDDFRAFMEMHAYIFTPSGAMWPASSVNSRIPPIPLVDKNGEPLLDDEGKQRKISAAAWLDKHRPVETMAWAHGEPMLIPDRLIRMVDG
jgi:hypothetical protein